MSAIAGGSEEVIQVLFVLQPEFNALHFTGPLEVLTTALHNISNPSKHDLSIS